MLSRLLTSLLVGTLAAHKVQADDDVLVRFPHDQTVVGQNIEITVFEDAVDDLDDRLWFARILVTPPNSSTTLVYSTTNVNVDTEQTDDIQDILSNPDVSLDEWATILPQELCVTIPRDDDDDDDDDRDDRDPAFGTTYTPTETGTFEAIVEFIFWYGEGGYRRPSGTSDVCINAPYQGEASRVTKQWSVVEAGSSVTFTGTPSPTEARLTPSPTGEDFDDDDDDDGNGTRPQRTSGTSSSVPQGSQTSLPSEPSDGRKTAYTSVFAALAFFGIPLMVLA